MPGARIHDQGDVALLVEVDAGLEVAPRDGGAIVGFAQWGHGKPYLVERSSRREYLIVHWLGFPSSPQAGSAESRQ